MYIHILVTNTAAPRMTVSILEVKTKLKRSIIVQLPTVKYKEILRDFVLLDFLKWYVFPCY